MKLALERYLDQLARWPKEGEHVLAQFDEEHVVVYQAYKPAIGTSAARKGSLSGVEGFSMSRMTWIKPNFLWMMFRSGWGTKLDQETTLALHMKRTMFDALIASGVSSSVKGGSHDVRVQWDPDHDPKGIPVARRAIQIGVSGKTLAAMLAAIDLIEDISDFVATERTRPIADLVTPRETAYPVSRGADALRT